MHCEQNAKIHAYHDGELAPTERAAVEAHLSDCGDCRELLGELRNVSQLVATAPLAEMPASSMTRLQQAWWAAAQDRGVLRIASWLTAAAAAVIFAAVLFSPSHRVENSTSSWQVNALTPPGELQDQDEPQDETIDAAQWIANDLALAMR